jgi:hypothetical protein
MSSLIFDFTLYERSINFSSPVKIFPFKYSYTMKHMQKTAIHFVHDLIIRRFVSSTKMALKYLT